MKKTSKSGSLDLVSYRGGSDSVVMSVLVRSSTITNRSKIADVRVKYAQRNADDQSRLRHLPDALRLATGVHVFLFFAAATLKRPSQPGRYAWLLLSLRALTLSGRRRISLSEAGSGRFVRPITTTSNNHVRSTFTTIHRTRYERLDPRQLDNYWSRLRRPYIRYCVKASSAAANAFAILQPTPYLNHRNRQPALRDRLNFSLEHT